MRIHLRGVVVEVDDDDPKALEIERVLFGAPIERPKAPEPPPPLPEVPEAFRGFWRALKPKYRHELSMLVEKPWPVAELEKALGLRGRHALRGWHGGIGLTARHHKVRHPIRASGYGRKRRRFLVREPAAGWIRTLLKEDALRAEYLAKAPVAM